MFQNLSQSLSLLRDKRFGTFWFANFLSSIGIWTQQVGESWLLLTLGASSVVLGLNSFASNAPVLALTLVGGALADRGDRRKIIAGFQSIQMLCPIVVVIGLATDSVTPLLLVFLSLIVGITDALSMPSFQSIVPTIVPREKIGLGIALNSTQFNLSRIVGPAIAGVLMTSAGALACFGVSALSYIPFIWVALWILPRGAPAPEEGQPKHSSRPWSGVRAVLAEDDLRKAVSTVLATGVLCGPLVTFIPLLVKEEFEGTATFYSLALAAFGAGGLLGAGVMLSLAASYDRRKLTAILALGFALSLVLNALNPWKWAAPLLLVFAGATMTISNTAANSILQERADPRLVGQAVSLYMLAMRGGVSLGAVLLGAAIKGLGIRTALLVFGLLAIVVQLIQTKEWLKLRPLPGSPEAGPAR